MRGTSLVALALASLLLAAQPAAAASATMNLAVLGGGGVLEGGSTFSVQGMALTVATPRKPVAVSFSNLVLDGAHLHCTVTATDCLAVPATAELTCEDSSVHNVEAGVLGTSFGSLDETPVTAGFIQALLIALMPDERFDARFNAGLERRNRSGWDAVLVAIATLAGGAIALMTTLALLFQTYFEHTLAR